MLSAEERQEILDAIKDEPFREFVLAMMETSARPGEVRTVTAAHVNRPVSRRASASFRLPTS